MAPEQTPRPPGRGSLDQQGIMEIIPHRDPFLLLSRVIDREPGLWAIAELDVSPDMFWVPGHFPGHPVMPGVLIVESLAQCGAVALLESSENAGKIAYFAGIDKVRFKRQVVPGEVLVLECEITRSRGPIGYGQAVASVGDELACSGELLFAIK